MAKLEIYFLGDYRVLWNKAPLQQFPTRKARGLFAYLVTHHHRLHSRELLAGIFWPEYPEDRALRNLSTTLWRLRQILPPAYLQAQGESIGFVSQTDCWIDFQIFEELCLEPEPNSEGPYRSLEQAVELYKGDFLAGWYQEWALIEVERLRSLFLQALSDLMTCYREQDRAQAALNAGLKIVQNDPLREDVHLTVMKLYALLGQRQAALQQFRTCQTILQDELDLAPTAEMLTLHEQLRAMPLPDRVKPAEFGSLDVDRRHIQSRTPFDDFGSIPLIGRAAERNQLLDRLDRLVDQKGEFVLIEGQPGVGKTRLVEDIAAGAEWRGMQVLWGQCSDEPYAPLLKALTNALTPLRISQLSKLLDRHFFAPLISLLPDIKPALLDIDGFPRAEEYNKDDLHQALLACMLALSKIGAHLLILEDCQRIDPATFEFLSRLAEQLPQARLLVLGTARPGELRERSDIWQQILALDRQGLVQSLEIAPLSLSDTQMLVQLLLGQDHPQTGISKTIYQQTQGNPLFIIETLKACFENGQIHKDQSGLWYIEHSDDSPLPKAIQDVILARLAKLTGPERRLLEIASLMNAPFDYPVWQLAAGWDDEATLVHSNHLLQRQLLVEAPDGYRFGHDLIRQVVLEQIAEPQRCQFHHQVAEALLECFPERSEELARHFHHAAQAGQTLFYAWEAGLKAERLHATQTAIEFHSMAIQWARKMGGQEGDLKFIQSAERRGKCYEIVGNYLLALEDFQAMLRAAENLGDLQKMAQATRLIGWHLGDRLGDRNRGLQKANRALEFAQRADDQQLVALIYRDIGAYYNMLGQHAQSIEALNKALKIFQNLADLKGEAACLQFLAVGYHFISQHQQSLQYYQKALALWQQLDKKIESANTLCDMGYLLLSQGDLNQAMHALEDSLQIFQEIGARGFLAWVMLGIGALHRYQLQGEQSLSVLAEAQTYSAETQKASPYTSSLMALHRGMAHWGLGHYESALIDLDQSLVLARQSKIPTVIVGILGDYGRCLRQMGEFEQAREFHQEALVLAQEVEFQDGIVRISSELGLGRVLSGNPKNGIQLLDEVLEQSDESSDWRNAEVFLNLAQAHLSLGHIERALNFSGLAVEMIEPMELWELGVWAYLMRGQSLFAAGETVQAKETLERGLALFPENCLSMTQFRLLVALGALACSQRSDYMQQLQFMVDQLSQKLNNLDLKHTLLSEWQRISAAADIPLTYPGQGQIYAMVRGAGAEDRIRILWTLDAGEADALLLEQEGKIALRRQRIRRLLDEAAQQGADPTQEDLATALGISVRTIRSDLRVLQV
jgi:DNA-binding SARP family transcriptional activator